MSDYANGTPPGQNNLDATVERYVDPKNDPSAGAQKPDSEQPKESGIEVREDVKPEVQQELDQASKNLVGPSSVEETQQREEEEQDQPQQKAPPPPKVAPDAAKDSQPKSSTTTAPKK